MIVLENDNIVYCDVDDTLVTFYSPKDRIKTIEVEFNNIVYTHYVLTENVEQLYRHASRGHEIVVWSQGGAKWAASVVNALGLDSLVSVVMGKPKFLIDDLEASEWMPKARLAKRDFA